MHGRHARAKVVGALRYSYRAVCAHAADAKERRLRRQRGALALLAAKEPLGSRGVLLTVCFSPPSEECALATLPLLHKECYLAATYNYRAYFSKTRDFIHEHYFACRGSAHINCNVTL